MSDLSIKYRDAANVLRSLLARLHSDGTSQVLVVEASPPPSFDVVVLGSIGTTTLQLTASSKPTRSAIIVKADPANTGTVYIVTSGSKTAADGFALAPGDVVVVPLDNFNKVWAVGSASGQKIEALAGV